MRFRSEVHPLRVDEEDSYMLWTKAGNTPTQTDLDRLYRRLEIAEYFMDNVDVWDSDFPLFMEWRQLKEENFQEYIDEPTRNIPTGNYYRTEHDE